MANGGGPTPEELPAPAASNITPKALAGFRHELDQRKYDAVDDSWAGSVPAQYGVAPRIRIGHSKWFNLLWLLPIGFVLLIVSIAVAKGLRDVPAVAQFMATYPGTVVPQGAEENAGFPAWVGWQHFFNMLLIESPRVLWRLG